MGDFFDFCNDYTMDDFEIGKYVQAGGYGTVYSATRKMDNKQVALKFFGYTRKKPDIEEIEKEINLMREMDGVQGTCQLLGVMYDSIEGYVPNKHPVHGNFPYPILIMELLGDDLFAHLQRRGNISLNNLAEAFRSAMLALKSIHDRNFLHRDLKIENIVMGSLQFDCIELKIIDFGLMIHVDDPIQGTVVDKVCGSYGCFAPESLKHKHYSVKSDIWQAGCILYSLLSGFPPFHIDISANSAICDGKYFPMEGVPQWQIPSEESKDLVRRMLDVDPVKRIDMDGILNHPWLRSATTPDIGNKPILDMGINYRTRIRNLVYRNRLRRYIMNNNATEGFVDSEVAARFYFEGFNHVREGYVSLASLVEGIEELISFSDIEANSVSRAELEQLFQIIDVDGNGLIDFSEFKTFYETLLSRTTEMSVNQGCLRLTVSESEMNAKASFPSEECQYCMIS